MKRRPLPLLLALATAVLAACGGPPPPKGPPPEYEEPPAPSWLDGGAPSSALSAGSSPRDAAAD